MSYGDARPAAATIIRQILSVSASEQQQKYPQLNKIIEIIDISVEQLLERILVNGFKCLCE